MHHPAIGNGLSKNQIAKTFKTQIVGELFYPNTKYPTNILLVFSPSPKTAPLSMEKLAPPTPCTLIARPISYVTTYHLGYMYNVQYILYHLYLGILGMVQGLGFTTLPSNFGYEKNKCWGTGRGKKWVQNDGAPYSIPDLWTSAILYHAPITVGSRPLFLM